MNRGLRKELAVLMGLAALVSLPRRKKTLSLGLIAGSAALALIKTKADSFTGQSVVITGGSRGLGLALALEFVKEGALVAILARDTEELERAHKQILGTYPDAHVLAIPCDVTKPTDVEAAFQKVSKQFGSLDVLINNAGSISVGPYDQMRAQDFAAQLELHFYGAMSSINQALPYLRQSIGKRIVNIISMGGRVAVPHMLPYDVSKFALAALSQGLNAELAVQGISVTSVFPALMRTGSPIQAVFKGDHEKEFAWFQSADVLPGFSSSAEDVARKIMESARHRDAELVPSLPGKLRGVVASLFPELAATALKVMASVLPSGGTAEYKTGAQSRALFDKSMLTMPFRKASHDAEDQLNQAAKFDPEFNLGLKKNLH